MEKIESIITVTLNPAIDRILRVPGFHIGGHLEGEQISRQPAGKGINVSRALARLGQQCLATGLVFRSYMKEFEHSLTSEGVETRFAATAGFTRKNVTIVDPEAGTETHIRDRGSRIGADEFAVQADLLRNLAQPGVLFIFAGSLPPGITHAQLGELIELCHAAGSSVAVDTNGLALEEAVSKPICLVKPNLAELSELVPLDSDVDPLGKAQELTRHIEFVLVSRGPEGAILVSQTEVLDGRVQGVGPDEIKNTVGCGDCLLAGFVSGLSQGNSPTEALRLALATATAAACTERTSDFTLDQVRSIHDRVEVQPVPVFYKENANKPSED